MASQTDTAQHAHAQQSRASCAHAQQSRQASLLELLPYDYFSDQVESALIAALHRARAAIDSDAGTPISRLETVGKVLWALQGGA